jgi:outer membrane protein
MRHFFFIPALCLSFVAVSAASETPRSMSLAEAIQLSATTVNVGVSRLDAAIARTQMDVQSAQLRPQIELVGTWLRQRAYQQIDNIPLALTPDNTLDGRIRIGQSLIDGERWYARGAARYRLDAAEASTVLALDNAAIQAALAYADLAIAESLIGVRENDLRLAKELLTLAEAQVRGGVSEGIALTRASTRVANAQASLTTAQGNRQLANIVLCRSLQLNPGTTLVPDKTLSDEMNRHTTADNVDTIITQALRLRPEMHVTEATLRALRADTRSALGARLPTVQAFADAGRSGPEFDDTTTNWRAGIEVHVPLVNGDKYNHRAAELRYEQQTLISADLSERIAAEVRSAMVALETGRAGLTHAREEKRLAEQEVAEARRRFETGVAGNLEVIDAQRSLASANQQLITAEGLVLRAHYSLARTMGQATLLK